jgi:hypothetical protein
MATRSSIYGGKAAGAWSWPLTPSSAHVKNDGVILPLTPYVFMARYLIN